MLNKVSKGKKINLKKILWSVLFVVATVVTSALFSIGLYELIAVLDPNINRPPLPPKPNEN